MTAVVDVSDLERQILTEGARLRDAAAATVLADCKDACPVGADSPTRKTPPGGLRDSLAIQATTDEGPVFTATVGSDLDYAQFTDDVDTSPHIITPTAFPALRFWWENGPQGPSIYHFKRVLHPGTRGQHWFVSKNQERWDSALAEANSG